MALFAGAILFQAFRVQFVQKDRWLKIAEKERVYYKKVFAHRGSILAEDGTVLATSEPFFKLSLDPSEIRPEEFEDFNGELNELCQNLADNFGSERFDANYFHSKIQGAIESNDRHLYLYSKPVNFREYMMAKEWPILKNSRFKGGLLGEKLNNKRFYPFQNLGKITLGILRGDTMALKGLEFSFDKDLKGEDGQILVQKISGSNEIPVEDYGESGAKDGSDILTTLDVQMQDITEAALERALVTNNAAFGTAILMEVETGEIKAIANLKRSEDSTTYYEGYNYAVAELVEPGSTMKLASLLALLEEGLNPEDTIDTGKGWQQFYGETMKDDFVYGKIDFFRAFEVSSNVATALAVDEKFKDDPGKFIAYLDKIGMLNKVNRQIIGEPDPDVIRPGTEEWNLTTLPWMSIGYNIRLTPLQILSFYNSIANDGKYIEPRIVKEVRVGTYVQKKYSPRVVKKQICSKKTATTLQQMMEGVVQRGTARRIKSRDIKMAGKTGTAKKVKDKTYQKVYRASFAGYFPADNPRYSCFVLVDEPSEGQFYGAAVAAPVFKEIAEQVYGLDTELSKDFNETPSAESPSGPTTRMLNQQNAKKVYRTLDIDAPTEVEAQWVRTSQDADGIYMKPVELKEGVVPSVRGMSARDAVNLLENMGLKVELQGYGKVRTQSLDKGARIGEGQTITLELK